jgi:hypothetical protein
MPYQGLRAPPLAIISSRLRRLEFASRIEDAGAHSSSISVFTKRHFLECYSCHFPEMKPGFFEIIGVSLEA